MTEISHRYIVNSSDEALLKRIGEYVKQTRLQYNRSQKEVAHDAGVSRSTLSLLERGEGCNLSSLIQVLRVLGALHVLQDFEVIHQVSPMALAKEDRARRKRASSSKNSPDNSKPESQW